MTYQCERCGQTALETDTVCWHCGWRFPKQEPRKPGPKVKVGVDEEQPLSLSAAAVYAVLTLVTVVAIMLVTRSLNQKPFFITNPEISLRPGWTPITDQEQNFTLNIPSQWLWFERQNGEQRATFDAMLAGNDQFHTAVAPLKNIASDTEILLIATEDTGAENPAPPGFLVVARSTALKQLSTEEVLGLIRQDAGNLLNVEIAESFTGGNEVDVLLETGSNDNTLRCHERLIQGQQAGYLVAGCTPRVGFPRYRDELDEIVGSFQPLLR